MQLLYAMVHHSFMSIGAVAAVNAATILCILVVWRQAGPRFQPSGVLPGLPVVLKYAAVTLAALFAVAPVLQTLTQSYKSSTIWALNIVLASVHVAVYDYRSTTGTSTA